MDININADLKALKKDLTRLQRKQIPFAAEGAINGTLYGLRQELRQKVTKEIDRPRAFTVNAFIYKKATKRALEGVHYIKDKQATYLKYMIDGGTKLPRRRALPVPVARGVATKRHGNMPKNRIKNLLSDPRNFSGEVNGVAGIWRRPLRGRRRDGSYGTKGKQKGLKLLVLWTPTAEYKGNYFKYYEHAERFIRAEFPTQLRRSMIKAIATAK